MFTMSKPFPISLDSPKDLNLLSTMDPINKKIHICQQLHLL